MIQLDKPVWQWIFLIFLAFIWGSSFILMKRGLETYDHFQVASLRIFISFLFLSPVILKNFRQIKPKQWAKVFLAGLLGSGIPAFLFTTAQTEIPSSLSGMLNSLVPLFTVVIGVFFFKMKFAGLKALGVSVGLIGAIGLLGASTAINLSSKTMLYGSLVVLATVCYAINVNFIKSKLSEVSSLNITSFGFLLIGPIAGIYVFNTDFVDLFNAKSEAKLHLFYIALLSIFGTAIAVILFNMLIKKVSAVFASSVTYIIPVFAILWGAVDGENILVSQLLFITVILTGIYITNLDNRREKKKSK